MNAKETAGFLTMLVAYWPTFKIEASEGGFPGTLEIWAQALERFDRADCLSVLEWFRDADPRPFKDRQYAPSASHFCGALRERAQVSRKAAQDARFKLEMDSTPLADPEKLLALVETVKSLALAKAMPKLRKSDCGPDETHDWKGTFDFIDSLPSEPKRRRRA